MQIFYYVLKRTITMLVTLLMTVTFMFFLFRLLPGDPTIVFLAGGDVPSSVRQELIARFGLDRPVYEQFFLYMRNLFLGEFGWSFYYNRPVLEMIEAKIWNTLILAFVSFFVAFSIALVVAPVLVLKRETLVEKFGFNVIFVLRAVPQFWLGMIGLVTLAVYLRWLPPGGMFSPGQAAGGTMSYFSIDFLRHLILPTAVYASYIIGLPALILRSTMLEELSKDYVKLLKSKGLNSKEIIFGHILRNSMLPFVTVATLFIGVAFGGQVVIEYIFSWPGIGRDLVTALSRRDYPLAQGIFFFTSLIVLIMNYAADLLYMVLDPRIKFGE